MNSTAKISRTEATLQPQWLCCTIVPCGGNVPEPFSRYSPYTDLEGAMDNLTLLIPLYHSTFMYKSQQSCQNPYFTVEIEHCSLHLRR
jgi:hypothetical protein